MIKRRFTQVTSVLLIILGLAMVVITVAEGGGIGILLGVLFVAAGAGRLFLAGKRTVR